MVKNGEIYVHDQLFKRLGIRVGEVRAGVLLCKLKYVTKLFKIIQLLTRFPGETRKKLKIR